MWGSELIAPHYAAAWAWAGNAPFQWGKQVGLTPRWYPQPDGDPLAHSDQRRRGRPLPLHALHRRRPDHPRQSPGSRSRPTSTGSSSSRCTASPSPTPWPTRRTRTTHPAVLRDRRLPRHVQGRMVAVDDAGPHPVGLATRCHPGTRARRLGPRSRRDRALLPPGRLHAEQGSGRAASGQGRGAEGVVLGGGRERYQVLPLLGGLSVFFGMLPPLGNRPDSPTTTTSRTLPRG